MPLYSQGCVRLKRHFHDKPTTIRRDDINTNTHIELVEKENVHETLVNTNPHLRCHNI